MRNARRHKRNTHRIKRKSPRINSVLETGAFSLHYLVGRFLKVGFLTQCCVIATLSACAVVAGSVMDGSLILDGRNVGLFEHPGIWVFFGLQIALPLSIRHSLKKLLRARKRISEITKSEVGFSEIVSKPLLEFLHLQNKEGKFAAAIIYCTGLAAFVWNTYQNQLPGIVVPFDFWDSKNYFWGFWITRVYKFYLLVWLLPYIAMVHISILSVTLRLIRRARLSGKLKLIPFHPDGFGGLGFMPSLVTIPIIVTLLMSSASTAAAFEVHRAADVTPLMGLAVVIISVGVAYIVPILFLRADITSMKRETIEKLRLLQQSYYSKIIDDQNLDFEKLSKGNEALDYFEKVCGKIQSISNYPHLGRLLRYAGLSLIPSVISVILKVYDIAPIIGPILKKP
jgi:hypothetical protein